MSQLLGPAPTGRTGTGTHIGSNFWKFYLTRTGFTLGESFSLVKVFRLFRLEWIFLVFRVWTQYIDVEHLIYWQGQRVCDALLDIEIDIVGGWKCLHIMGFFNLLHLFGRTQVLTVEHAQVSIEILYKPPVKSLELIFNWGPCWNLPLFCLSLNMQALFNMFNIVVFKLFSHGRFCFTC